MSRAALLSVAGLCLYGFVQLLSLRFDRGDIYPMYSSLRADPLGTKALYDAVDSMPTTSAIRQRSRRARPDPGPEVTWLHLGGTANEFYYDRDSHRNSLARLTPAIEKGARLVWALRDADAEHCTAVGCNAPRREARPRPPASAQHSESPPAKPGAATLNTTTDGVHEAWGVRLVGAPRNRVGTAVRTPNIRDALPASLRWRGLAYFDQLDPSWQTLYVVDGKAVIIERRLGEGSLVLVAESIWFTNEAMRSRRETALLSWLIGTPKWLVFEETHLGVTSASGIAALARSYHLEGLFLGLLVAAGLYVWRMTHPLVPAAATPSTRRRTGSAATRSATAGLTQLLRRAIPNSELVGACADEAVGTYNERQPALGDAERFRKLSQQESDPVGRFNQLNQLVQSNRHLRKRL